MRYVLPKRRFSQEPNGITSHNTAFFIVTNWLFYIQEEGILRNNRIENLKSYVQATGWGLTEK
jgi:hypothetical protein